MIEKKIRNLTFDFFGNEKATKWQRNYRNIITPTYIASQLPIFTHLFYRFSP